MKIESAVFEMSAALVSQLPEPIRPEIALSGRSNVGKSSLINKVLGRKSLARTSATPGKTATINFYRLDILRLVDLPGYGYARVSNSEKKRWKDLIEGYLNSDRDLRLVIQLLDIRHSPSKDDMMMLDFLVQSEIPFIVALTKADKLNKTERSERLHSLQVELADWEGIHMIPVSAVTGEGIEEIREILEEVTESDS